MVRKAAREEAPANEGLARANKLGVCKPKQYSLPACTPESFVVASLVPVQRTTCRVLCKWHWCSRPKQSSMLLAAGLASATTSVHPGLWCRLLALQVQRLSPSLHQDACCTSHQGWTLSRKRLRASPGRCCSFHARWYQSKVLCWCEPSINHSKLSCVATQLAMT
jgi:hypothetical protein